MQNLNAIKMPNEEEPSSSNTLRVVKPEGMFSWLSSILKIKPDTSLREAIEEYIIEPDDYSEGSTFSSEERSILANILKLQNMHVTDVMVPRANIVAIEIETTKAQLFKLLSEKQFSRIPVFKNTLDDVVGTIHIKDVMAALAKEQDIVIKDMLTDIPIVSPSLSVLDLVIKMRQSRRHMVLVVDEYGGIDGLVTIGDVIESIIGEIADEHALPADYEIRINDDGSVIADGRVHIDEFESHFGDVIKDEEKYESNTLAGVVSTLAGRVPARGEILKHESGMVFEILDADPRRVNRLKITHIPAAKEPATPAQGNK